MNRYHSPDKKDKQKIFQYIRCPIVQRKSYAYPSNQNQYYQHKLTLEPTSQLLSFLIMKQKHIDLHEHNAIIQQNQQQQNIRITQSNLLNNKKKVESMTSHHKILPYESNFTEKQVTKIRKGLIDHKKVLQNELEINTVSQGCRTRHSSNPLSQIQLIRRSKYHKKLQPLKLCQNNKKLSNNIRDYISVQKISIKQSEDSYLLKSKMFQKYHLDILLHRQQQFQNKDGRQVGGTKSFQLQKIDSPDKRNMLTRRVVFKPPFPMYYYRDFIWKVAYSNGYIVQIPEEYEQRVKFYVGPGNNSNLIKGIMNRRTWFQLVDKSQDAQLIWTQIKVNHIFSEQKTGITTAQITKQELNKITTKQQSKAQNLYSKQYKILNKLQKYYWNNYWSKSISRQNTIKPTLQIRSKCLSQQQIQISKREPFKVHNHFINNFIIGNKKALFKTMSEYYKNGNKNVFDYLPLTFHIKEGLEDHNYLQFCKHFYAIAKENKQNYEQSINKFNAWIIKPGENTNRGNGIIVCLTLNQIKVILKSKQKHQDGSQKTYILQKYIQRPLLYKRRKFDLRHYMMINCSNGRMKGYWYRQGYVRTTSSQYTLRANDGSIHLTNDAVQKNLPDYGKYQRGNKITYEQLHTFINKQDSSFQFYEKIYPRMREIATDAIKASALNIDPLRKNHNFQIFGLDFMIDQHYNVWLIQINTNPCLETGCPVLLKIIPKFIENTIQICIDPLFPAPLSFAPKSQQFNKNVSQENNYDLVFDQRIDGIVQVSQKILQNPEQDDDVFDDDGQDFN